MSRQYSKDTQRAVTRKGYLDYTVYGPRDAHTVGIPKELAWHYATGQEAARQHVGEDEALKTIELYHGPGASYSYHDGIKGAKHMRGMRNDL